MSYNTSREIIKPVFGLDHSVVGRHHSKIPIIGPLRPRYLSESSESEEEDSSSSNQSSVYTTSRDLGVTNPNYHEYYSLSNSSYSPYTTVFPDVSLHLRGQ